MNSQNSLMKHFSGVLRKRALGKGVLDGTASQQLLKHLTRRELVQILSNKHQGQLPKELDLVEMENSQLLELIGDELYILAHLAHQWCQDVEVPSASEPAEEKKPSKAPKSAKKS